MIMYPGSRPLWQPDQLSFLEGGCEDSYMLRVIPPNATRGSLLISRYIRLFYKRMLAGFNTRTHTRHYISNRQCNNLAPGSYCIAWTVWKNVETSVFYKSTVKVKWSRRYEANRIMRQIIDLSIWGSWTSWSRWSQRRSTHRSIAIPIKYPLRPWPAWPNARRLSKLLQFLLIHVL